MVDRLRSAKKETTCVVRPFRRVQSTTLVTSDSNSTLLPLVR